eukprot:4254438-Amphidinium_carterae.1
MQQLDAEYQERQLYRQDLVCGSWKWNCLAHKAYQDGLAWVRDIYGGRQARNWDRDDAGLMSFV